MLAYRIITVEKPLFYLSLSFSLPLTIIGIFIIAMFTYYIHYKDYDIAWSFYFFMIGWMFIMSILITSFADRNYIDKRIISGSQSGKTEVTCPIQETILQFTMQHHDYVDISMLVKLNLGVNRFSKT